MRSFSKKERLGAALLDGPRFLRAWASREGWCDLRNRADRLEKNPAGPGVRCVWEFTRSLHFCDVYPAAGGWLLRRALQTAPIRLKNEPEHVSQARVCANGAGPIASASIPDVSFLIGHRGQERLPLLLATLESIAAQAGVAFECVVVEQDTVPRVRDALPPWVRWMHTPVPPDLPYCRSWAFNVAARLARAPLLVCHDNDMLVPERYACDMLSHFRAGYEAMDLKRFVFYLGEGNGPLHPALAGPGRFQVETVIQNLRGGGSVAIGRSAFEAIGGFDEAFVGCGGEDNEFWDRCRTRKTWEYTRLPLIHLWHAPQPGKRYADGLGRDTGDLFRRLRAIPPETRIANLRAQTRGDPAVAPARPVAAASANIPGLVSTIIPVHNRAALLREAVASVLAQTYRPIEIIIVDDGSTDDTGAAADELAAEQPESIRVLHRPNGGPGAAREAGRQTARGEFIQYLDSDDLLTPRKFEWQVAALRARPECGVAYGATAYEDVTTGKVEYPWRRTGEAIENMFPAFAAERWWGTSTPLYRRAVTDAAGPWLNLLNCEDWEYDCRIAAKGVALARVAEKISQQRHHPWGRLSAGGTVEPNKLRHRCLAHEQIARHITAAGLTDACPEVQQFAQLTFLLARQCGAAELGCESKALLDVVRRLCPDTLAATAKFRLYRRVAQMMGYVRVGRWSATRDRLSQRLRRGRS